MSRRRHNPSDKQLRRRCEALLEELPLPVPFDERALCRLVARQRGRPILLRAKNFPDEVLGMWVAYDAVDVIYYEWATTVPHQGHIILHELSHILCGHQPDMARVFRHLSAERVHGVLGRSTCLDVDEREAELLASLIQQRADRAPRTAPAAPPPGPADRIWAALGGW